MELTARVADIHVRSRKNESGNLMKEALATTNDETLLRLMRAGDTEAFAELYDRRQAGVYRFALRMSGSPSIAEDVTQDVFMALMRDGNAYDSVRGSVAAYLYGIA